MIELPAMDSVALSLHHAPGVYALLVGSGLSTAAGIPTGWDITLELVRRLAVLQGVEDQKTPDQWEQWYVETYGGPPSYSALVGKVAQTADERRNILHDFIEPREGEEARRPGKAHEAIAKLVASGAVKVIITTNFDRLIETALKGAGVEPTVIASDDAVQGATPLVHSRCTVIKVHGDYLDARIRNTDEELAGYSEPMNRLLGEVFANFGLIVAGWSATWDTALCDAIRRARSRRYSLYWARRGALTQHASDIVEAQGGRTIEIPDADSFFGKLVDSVEALACSSKPHPQSTELALQLAKKYCRDDKYDAEWAEFIFQEIKSIKSFVESIDCNQPRSNEEKNSLLRQFVERTEILRKSALICGRWGTFNAKKLMFENLISIYYGFARPKGMFELISMRDFGFSICCYWLIAGFINSNEWVLLKTILTTEMKYDGRNIVAVEVIPFNLYRIIDWDFINGYENRITPISDFVFNLFKIESEVISLTPEKSEFLFDEVEMILAIQFHHVAPSKHHFCSGRFAWKERDDSLLSRYENLDKNSPILQSGLFGGTPENASAAVSLTRDYIRQSSRFF